MTATPCADCKTTGGYVHPKMIKPMRQSGAAYGFDGMLCNACRTRHHKRNNPKLWAGSHKAKTEAVPCADCKSTDGYREPGQGRPRRRKGDCFGIEGMLCQKCYFKRYNQFRLIPKPVKVKAAPKILKPFVVDPRDHKNLVWGVALWFKNKPFVKYHARSIDLDDLVSEGQIGLLKACRNYIPDSGIKFSSYAVVCIKSTIMRMLGSRARLIHIPEYLHKGLRENAPEPRSGKHAECLAAAREIRSREIVGEGSLEEPLANLVFSRPEASVEHAETVDKVAGLLDTLPETEAAVLRLRFGFDSASRSREQIAKTLGVSNDMVRGYEERAIRRLRKQLEACA